MLSTIRQFLPSVSHHAALENETDWIRTELASLKVPRVWRQFWRVNNTYKSFTDRHKFHLYLFLVDLSMIIDIVFTYLIFSSNWLDLAWSFLGWPDLFFNHLIFSVTSLAWSLIFLSIDIFFPGLMRCTSRWLHSQGAVVCWRQYCLLYLVVSVHSTVSSSCQDLQVIINGQDNYLSVFLLVSILQQALLICQADRDKDWQDIHWVIITVMINNYRILCFFNISLCHSDS